LPIAFSTSEISNSEVGQTSGQWVKPKKISVGRPCMDFFGHGLTGLVGQLERAADRGRGRHIRNPPSAHSIRTSPTTRLPAKAPIMTSGRVVRSIMEFLVTLVTGSEAGGEPDADHLEEDRRSVVEPQRERADQKHDAPRPAPAITIAERHPACRRRYHPGQRCCGVETGKAIGDHLNELKKRVAWSRRPPIYPVQIRPVGGRASAPAARHADHVMLT
jgi:hypothetical protein